MKDQKKVLFHVDKSNINNQNVINNTSNMNIANNINNINNLSNFNNINNINQENNKENKTNIDLFKSQISLLKEPQLNNIINNSNNQLINFTQGINPNSKILFQNPQKIFLLERNNNVFNSIRNNQNLFVHSFLNEKVSHFISFLEEPINNSFVVNLTSLIENRKGFEEFVEEFDWEYYGLILYIATCKMNSDIFDKYNEYIMIYLYDGMKKLNEINFTQEIKNNKNKKYFLGKLFCEKDYFYKVKKEDFLTNSENENKLECVIDDNNFFCESFIYYKLNQEKAIDLTDYKYNSHTIQPLLNVLKFKENIQELNLTNNDIGYEGCYSLGNMLRTNKNMTNLNLSSCKINSLGLTYLLKGIISNPSPEKYNLTQLNLSDNKLDENSGNNLGLILFYFTRLQWLNISNNKISNKGAENLFQKYKQILEDNMNRMESSLNLDSTNKYSFYNQSDLSLTNYNSKAVHNLDTLILIDIGIYSESCLKVLGEVIKMPLCGLKSLILSKNSIGINKTYNQNLEDIIYFLDCLKYNKTITELLLLSCNIGNNIANKIYEMLMVNKTIENLCLYDNKINEQFIFLQLLSLFSNLAKNHGVINNIMKVLDLSKNNCHIKIDNNFLNIIDELQLSSLDISQNELSKEGIEYFKSLANRIGDRLKIIY